LKPQVHRIVVENEQAVVLDWYPSTPGARAALFVQGLGSTRRGTKARYFAQRFNERGCAFAAVDLRGHGDSDGDIRDLTMSGMLADVAAAVSWLDQETASSDRVLIGSSMGAAVIAWHVSANRASVCPLVMLGPSLRFPASIAPAIGDDELERWRRSGLRRFSSEWIDLEIGYGLVTDGGHYDPDRLVREHAGPALIVHGMRDQVVDWRSSAAFAGDAPDLYLVSEGDHRLTNHRVLVFDVLCSWLRSLGWMPAE